MNQILRAISPAVALIALLLGGIYLSIRGGNLVKVTVMGDAVHITPTGFNTIWALKKTVTIPLSEIESARHDPNARRLPTGLRAPGTAVPGLILAGTYRGRAGKSFWLVHKGTSALVLELKEGAAYSRIVVDVTNPESVAKLIEESR